MKITLNTERLKKKREEKGWNKLVAAQKMGFPQGTYVRYENGSRTPAYSVIKSMAISLGTSVEYLTGQSDDDARSEFVVSCNDKYLEFIIESYYNFPDNKKKRLYKYAQKLSNTSNVSPFLSLHTPSQ